MPCIGFGTLFKERDSDALSDLPTSSSPLRTRDSAPRPILCQNQHRPSAMTYSTKRMPNAFPEVCETKFELLSISQIQGDHYFCWTSVVLTLET